MRRVEAAGCPAVCVTVDTPVLGIRTRQFRTGFELPPGLSTPLNRSGGGARGSMDLLHSPLRMEDIAWLRSIESGKLSLKCILHPTDADQATRLRVDGSMCAKHCATQL